MIRYFFYEVKIAGNVGGWLLPVFFAILRLTGVVWQPGNPAWLGFLEFVYPLPFPLLAYTILEGEKARRTLEVLIATPRRKGLVFFLRYLALTVPFFCTLVAMSYPGDWLLLLAPGLLLGGFTLVIGLGLGEEIGLGAGLAWWGVSLVFGVTKPQLLGHGVASWLLLILFSSPLSPQEVLLRKWAHLGAGLLLLLLTLALTDRKCSWKLR